MSSIISQECEPSHGYDVNRRVSLVLFSDVDDNSRCRWSEKSSHDNYCLRHALVQYDPIVGITGTVNDDSFVRGVC